MRGPVEESELSLLQTDSAVQLFAKRDGGIASRYDADSTDGDVAVFSQPCVLSISCPASWSADRVAAAKRPYLSISNSRSGVRPGRSGVDAADSSPEGITAAFGATSATSLWSVNQAPRLSVAALLQERPSSPARALRPCS